MINKRNALTSIIAYVGDERVHLPFVRLTIGVVVVPAPNNPPNKVGAKAVVVPLLANHFSRTSFNVVSVERCSAAGVIDGIFFVPS